MKIYDIYYWLFMISSGIVMTIISFFHAEAFFHIFFNICVGLFFGGILFSVISFFLAQMEANISGEGEIEIDTDIDIDVDIDTDIDIDTDVEIESDIEIDTDADVDSDIDTESDFDLSDITPAPIMLLLSASFLVYGISGIILYYIILDPIKFIIFFATPTIVYLDWKLINNTWKKIAKSRYYSISSTKNLIGTKGEVTLPIDYRGGIIKIPSPTPMRFEKIHVKPLHPESEFEREEVVYVCDVKNGFLLVDNNKKLIKRRG